MPMIKFRGKEYNSLADMPAKVRHDYFKVRAGYDVPEKEPESRSGGIPRGLEKMPGEVREIYERVRGKIDTKPVEASPVDGYAVCDGRNRLGHGVSHAPTPRSGASEPP